MSAAQRQAPVLVQADRVPAQPWRNGGGQTRELLVWPEAAQAGQAEQASAWRLRISRADIDASGPFSAFAGVQRWFVVLSGQGVVLHMPTADGPTQDHVLQPGHTPLHFDGALAPHCTLVNGPTQDLNLMARGGQACLQAVGAGTWSCSYAMGGLYTLHPGTWSDGQQTLQVPAHSLLWLQQAQESTLQFTPEKTDSPNATGTAGAWWLGFSPETS